MTTGRWVLVVLAGVVLVVSLILALQGHLGLWFTSVGMVCVLLSVWVGVRQSRKAQANKAKTRAKGPLP